MQLLNILPYLLGHVTEIHISSTDAHPVFVFKVFLGSCVSYLICGDGILDFRTLLFSFMLLRLVCFVLK